VQVKGSHSIHSFRTQTESGEISSFTHDASFSPDISYMDSPSYPHGLVTN
jgi:hypothetical protein